MLFTHRSRSRRLWGALLISTILLVPVATSAQSTTATGSIQGTITDASGAVVPGVAVTITSAATGQELHFVSSPAGTYNSGALLPGNYVLSADAKGFRPVSLPIRVEVGVVSAGNIRLQVGSERLVLSVESTAVTVNTEQATVQGVVTPEQIQELPTNGRNFLDLAQLEPGIQIQDGGDFHPTKTGFVGVSVGGRFGRTTRIELDGIDISDETVGTTTQNIPQSAIQEFQVSQSTLDLSTGITSSGAINVTTESGTNDFHGGGFYNFRSDDTAAKIRTGVPFQRNQFGGRLGGPILSDKLFFFVDAERTKQDMVAPVVLSPPFNVLDGTFNAPFRETETIGRIDWQIHPDWRAFYRFSYDEDMVFATFLPDTFQPFRNRNHTQVHAVGLDFSSGEFTHSIRFGYTKFSNVISDATASSGAFDPLPQIELGIGGDPTCVQAPNLFCSGPTILAPQEILQSNKQVKYDGSRIMGSHILRYGVGVNRILAGGFEALFKNAPGVLSVFNSQTELAASFGPFPGGESNPLNYPATLAVIGNGQGSFSEIPAFGLPGGGRADTRLSAYFGDLWKLKPNFTLSYGLHYVRDTGRTDSDIAPIPCSELSPLLAPTLPQPCTGDLLDVFGTGLGRRVNQPNENFGPQLGITWDPWSNGKTVFRGGIGLFYENSIFNDLSFDRPAREPNGLFFGAARPCPSGFVEMPDGTVVTTVNGLNIASQVCNQPIGLVASDFVALQQQFVAATSAIGAAGVNRTFVGNTLAEGLDSTGNQLIAPNYRAPYSIQMNAGVQRELRRGTVVTADYVRNVGLHFLIGYDTNHVGDARFLNV
ncbi:MAG TPA: carboxypeptidase-like regulatory domain-containing protein, partial [Terriglobales bacterium]|nr:carboxypeptidase-like regulatory domain-containing protein [Terriglobales bacterium]